MPRARSTIWAISLRALATSDGESAPFSAPSRSQSAETAKERHTADTNSAGILASPDS
jgi:hypothetical protein